MRKSPEDEQAPSGGLSWRGRLLAALVLALLALAFVVRTGVALYGRLLPSEQVEAPPRPVEVIRVAPVPFERTVRVAGTLEPVHSVDVFPKVEGKVIALHAGLGQRVAAGDPLATVEAVEWGLQARQAQVGLAMADQAADLAQRSLSRLDQVREQVGAGALSQQDYELAQIEAEGATTQRDVARLQAQLAQQMVKNATMRAPVDGTVSRVYARLGGMVGNQYPAFHVDDTSLLVLRCQVGDLDLPLVRVGQEVRLRSDALPGQELLGHVTAVAPTLDGMTRRAPVEIELANEEDAVTGNLFARGEIVVDSQQRALVLPLEAVARYGNEAQVQLVRQGAVQQRQVTILAESDETLALEGLEEGELVILPGPEHLAEGERVTPVERGGA